MSNTPQIIVPLKPQNLSQLEGYLNDKKLSQADLIEIWLDEIITDLSALGPLMAKAKKAHKVSFLGVCKTPEENGGFTRSPEDKKVALLSFLEQGGDFIDVDVRLNDHALITSLPPEKLWLSYHDFVGVPKNLSEIMMLMAQYNPQVYKFAVTVDSPVQLSDFLAFVKNFPKSQKGIFTTMGRCGQTGREQLKSVSYAGFYALSSSLKTASGQPVLD